MVMLFRLRHAVLAPWLALALLTTTLPSLAGSTPRLTISPANGFVDDPLHIQVNGIEPGRRVTLRTERNDAKGTRWIAVGTYQADWTGTVDTDVLPSLGGSFEGHSPHGLWCAVLPVEPAEAPAFIGSLTQSKQRSTPVTTVGETYRVAITAAIDGGQTLHAEASRALGADLHPEPVSADGPVRGMFFPARAGVAAGVPVLVIAGAGGGLPQAQAALLAERGHPALAIGVFGYQDLPEAMVNIPLESFRAGARWLEARTGVKRVAIMGTSRGSEAAGLAASWFPDDFDAAVLLVPSHLANGGLGPNVKGVVPAWTLHGKPISPAEAESLSNDATVLGMPAPGYIATPNYLDNWTDPHADADHGIPVERMRGPLLAIGGGADALWPSFIGAQKLGKRMIAHGLANQAEVKVYPGAGHSVASVGVGGALSTFIYLPVAKALLATGGLPNDNCEDSYDAWQTVLTFLDHKVVAEPR